MRRAVLAIVLVAASAAIGVGASPSEGAVFAGAPTSGYHQIGYDAALTPSSGTIGPDQPVAVDVTRSSSPATPPFVVPSDATFVAVRIRIRGVHRDTLVHAHACGSPVDVSAGAVVRSFAPVRAPENSGSNEVVVPVAGGTFCLTSTAPAVVETVSLLAYVDGTPGMTYVDLPDRVVFDGRLGSPAPPTMLRLDGLVAGFPTLRVTGYTRSSPASVTVGGCAGGPPFTTGPGVVDALDEQLVATTFLIGNSGVTCQLSATDADITVTLTGYFTDGPAPEGSAPAETRYRPGDLPLFTGTVPTRLADTRDRGAALGAGETLEVDLGGRVPADATAVALNVTATDPAAPGFVTVHPCSAPRPLASNLNATTGRAVPNAVIVGTGSRGRVCLYVSAAMHLVVDLGGWYRVGIGDGFVPSRPVRVFDTRASGRPVAAGGVYELDLGGAVGADATAAVLNVTATEPASAGYVTVYPCDGERPLASNLNVVAGQTVPNLVTVKLSSDRRACFYSQGRTHLLADLQGWYAPSSRVGLVANDPVRLFDTREGSVDRVPAQTAATLQFRRRAAAYVMNVTVDDPAADGYLTVYDCFGAPPVASNLNYRRGVTVPNLVVVPPTADRTVCFFNQAPVHYLADLLAVFSDQAYFAYVPDGADGS